MKKTKKILALLLVLAMSVCAFAACSKDEKKEETPESTNPTSVEPTVDSAEKAIADAVEEHKAEFISTCPEEFGEVSIAADGTRIKITANMTSIEAQYNALSSEEKDYLKKIIAPECATMADDFKAEFADSIKSNVPELTGVDIIFTVGNDVLYTFNIDL